MECKHYILKLVCGTFTQRPCLVFYLDLYSLVCNHYCSVKTVSLLIISQPQLFITDIFQSLPQPGLGQVKARSWEFSWISHMGGWSQVNGQSLVFLRVITGFLKLGTEAGISSKYCAVGSGHLNWNLNHQ